MQRAMPTFVERSNNSRISARHRQNTPKRTQEELPKGSTTSSNRKVSGSKTVQIQIQNTTSAQNGSMSRVRGHVRVCATRGAREKPAAPVPSKRRKISTPTPQFSVFVFEDTRDDDDDELVTREKCRWNAQPTKTGSRDGRRPLSATACPPCQPENSAIVGASASSGLVTTPEEDKFDDCCGAYSPEVLRTCRPAHQQPTDRNDTYDRSADVGGGGAFSFSSWLVPSDGVMARGTRNPRSTTARGEDTVDCGSSIGGREAGKSTSRAWSMSAAAGTTVSGSSSSSTLSMLSAWLEPQQHQVRKNKRTKRDDRARVDHDTRHGQVDANDEHDGRGDAVDDVGDEGWMSERLGGLDPSGAARAKDGWRDRERRSLTCMDIALGAKRKNSRKGGGGRGWKTRPGGRKVFVQPTKGKGTVVAEGQAAFRMAMSGCRR